MSRANSNQLKLPQKRVVIVEGPAKDDDVAGWSVSLSSLEQINEITKILDENLRQGALGIGSTPGYASQGISTYEQFEVQRAAARYGRWTGQTSAANLGPQLAAVHDLRSNDFGAAVDFTDAG